MTFVPLWLIQNFFETIKFEEWKTRFYDFEGYNKESGWPTGKTLEGMGLKKVANVMKNKGRLG